MAMPFVICRSVKPLLSKARPLKRLQRFGTKFIPLAGWLEKPKSLLFHPENIMKHKEVIPIAIFTMIGFSMEVAWTIRLAFTRDDVVFLNKKMAHEILETRVGPYYPPPVRKFFVFNQKYENCKGAIAAIQTPEEDIVTKKPEPEAQPKAA